MNKNEIINEFGNKQWKYLLEYDEVIDFVRDYQNIDTVKDILIFTHYFVKEANKHQPKFKITDILKLTPKEARTLIWDTCQSIVKWDKSHRIAIQSKTWITQFYQFNTEKTIVWKRHHRIPIITIRTDRHVPTHSEVFLICDNCYNIRDRALTLLIYNCGLSPKGICNLKMKHVKPILEKYIKDKELPLILKINANILPKRFTSNSKITWLPALIDRDCGNLLLQYYEKYRKEAKDEEPFFITKEGKKLIPDRLSTQIRHAIDRACEIKPQLKKSYTYLLRDSFYNRLIIGNMKDVYREFLMMHTQGIKEFYFSKEYHRNEIVKEYLKCNFNREEINQLEKIKELEVKTKKIENHMETLLQIRDEAVKQIPDIVKIRKDDVDRYMELRQMGYVKTMENHAFVVLEKQEST